MTQEEIIEMAIKVDLNGHELAYSDWFKNRLKAFAKLVAEREREACATMSDWILKEGGGTWGDAIRARGGDANTM
jgi:hypothetical protein